MPYELELPRRLKPPYRVKIQEKESCEEPHVTIWRKAKRFRYSLRGNGFLDPVPDPKELDKQVIDVVEDHLDDLREAWDRMYPHNPVGAV